MNNTATPETILYWELFFLLLSLAAASLIYAFLRLAFRKTASAKGKKVSLFFLRLSLPAALLIVALIFKIKPLAQALPVSPRFILFVDAALVFFIVFMVLRLFDTSLQSWYSRRGQPFPLPRVLHGLIEIVVYLIILFLVLRGIVGINITPFLATSAILTANLGLALQGVLGNLVSGMSLRLTKSFSSGHWVKIGPHEGVVVDTNWRETRILDRYSNIIVIPNNTVAAEMITNFSVPESNTALTIPVKVSSEVPPSLVIETLKEAAREAPEVIASPAPQGIIVGYDDFGISYILKFWITNFAQKNIIMSDVAKLVWHKFKRKNIVMPVALQDHLRNIMQAVRPQDRIPSETERSEAIYQDLLNSSFLRDQGEGRPGALIAPEEEIRELAKLVKKQLYAPGEVVFKQGERGESCYIVARGLIKGQIIYEDEGKKYSSEFTVGPGGLFGEMSLFTGMPRTATGTIQAESELLEIGTEAFGALLARNPQLSETIADMVSARNEQNREFLSKIKELSENDLKDGTNKKTILERLRRFVRIFKKSEP